MSSALTVHGLLAASALLDISVLELGAVRLPDIPEDIEQQGPIEPNYQLTTQARADNAGFRVSIATAIDTPVGHIRAEVAGEYELDAVLATDITAGVMLEFVNEVAIMTLIPYIRQSIADITLRVFGSALMMPMLQRGELSFSPDDARA